MVISTESKAVIITLDADEAARLASNCESLAIATGEEHYEVELELRRASDRAQGN